MLITKSFSRADFEFSLPAVTAKIDNTCPSDYISNILVVSTALEVIQDHFNLPVIIFSGYRSEEVNKLHGGSEDSAHLLGYAANFRVLGIPNDVVFAWIRANMIGFDQLIYGVEENDCVHLGMSQYRSRHEALTVSEVNGKMIYTRI